MIPCTGLMLLLLAAYLSGAVPWGLIVVRSLKKVDIRAFGSGNIGATNVRRVAGTWAALLVLLLDALKGAVPVLLIRFLGSPACGFEWQLASVFGALAAIIGHMFPVYLGFRPSGKGVATAWGCYLILSPWAALLALAVYGGVAGVSRKSALGSLTAAVALLPAVWVSTHNGILTFSAFISMVLIFLRHKENIAQLRQGSKPSSMDRSDGGNHGR